MVQPSDNSTLARASTWLPDGDAASGDSGAWFELSHGRMYAPSGDTRGGGAAALRASRAAPRVLSRAYELREAPVFARAGAVIATWPFAQQGSGAAAQQSPYIGRSTRQYDALEWMVVPPASGSAVAVGSGAVYEDDGESVAYLQGALAWTRLNYTASGRAVDVEISTTGAFPQLPTQRPHVLRLLNRLPATAVTVNGQPASAHAWPLAVGGAQQPAFWYDTDDMSVVVLTPALPVASPVRVHVQLSGSAAQEGDLQGARARVQHAVWAKQALDETRQAPGERAVQPAYLSQVRRRHRHRQHARN